MLIKIKQAILVIGDIVLLYAALFLMIWVRYGVVNKYLTDAHLVPFSIVFIFWVAIFYISGLYDLRTVKNRFGTAQQLMVAAVSSLIVSMIVFYLIPSFKIAPKRNLVIFSFIFFILSYGWRELFTLWAKTPQRKVLMVGGGKEADSMNEYLFGNLQLGYKVSFQISDVESTTSEYFSEVLDKYNIDTVIISPEAEHSQKILEDIYKNLPRGIEVMDFTSAYELFYKKIPLSSIHYLWVSTNISKSQRIYETIKRPLEIFFSLIMLVILSPLILLAAIGVKLTSKGPVFYTQPRVGKKQKTFTVYKFRTMIDGAYKAGPDWTEENDPRITSFGRFLRYTHFDEVPQLFNVLRGAMSFVGPRPESLPLVDSFRKKIPYYDARHLVKPGVTGWAQVNYKPSASIEEAYEKLQYDLYYIKERSFTLDFLIILKTVKMFIFNFK